MMFSRRGLMAAAAIAAAPSAVQAKPKAASPAPWGPDAVELAGRIRRKEVSALEVTEKAVRDAEALQDRLGALVTSDFDRAIDKARRLDQTPGQPAGPFAGVPFLVKDLDDYVGLPTRYGSRAMLRNPPAKTQDGYVDAFDRAGLIVIGKSATPEYGFLPTTEPVGFGPTRNPWNLAHSSGGSSGGAAAAVAAGITPFAHASDGGGSIRIPASNCGLFGLKPSRGRMILGRPPSRALDLSVYHCVSHSVRDSATLFAATERGGGDAVFPAVGLTTRPGKRRLRVGLLTDTMLGGKPDPEVREAVETAAKLMQSLGHKVEPTAWPVNGAAFGQDFLALWASGAADLVARVAKAAGRQPDGTMLDPFTLAMADLVNQMPAGGLEKAVANLNAAGRAYDGWFARYDVILSPVLGTPPAPLGWVAPTVDIPALTERLNAYVGYTTLHNVAGAPSMSVPLHWTKAGLPVGVQFAGRAGAEKTLLELAFELEAAQPWAWRKPPVSV
ncbi:6-aminohexanoate hydrolase [Caulobacter sp. Root655]|uniref:amidase n=1 Tax=Caulobacter sp. Root655 TaxID=1736578 RepID=UPI0006F2C0E0|nr:amidase [Caulobacter sp. Root655]KRA60447.1 6-aminohexanoate hydrolase [Caulobacter sp. Root655]